MIRRAATASFVVLALSAGLAVPASGQTAPGKSDLFQTHCAMCHGDDGKAQTEDGMKKHARDMTNAKWQGTVSDARLTRSITNGHEKMPAFGKKLSADEIQALLKEVRSFAPK